MGAARKPAVPADDPLAGLWTSAAMKPSYKQTKPSTLGGSGLGMDPFDDLALQHSLAGAPATKSGGRSSNQQPPSLI
jgi:hypothetical protein